VEKIVETGDNGEPISLNDQAPVTKYFLDIAENIMKQTSAL
jgi:septum formation inhibitor-activating ATPase MinD